MDKILKEAVDNIVGIFIIDVENVALAKGAVSKILKKLVEEKFTSTNSKGMPNGACEFSYRTGVAGRCGR